MTGVVVSRLLESDFRSPVPRLAQILAGRELESLHYAAEARDRGECDGIFVQGKEIREWRFLEKARGFERYVFTDVDRSFSSVDVSFMCDARDVSIGGISLAVDFSTFKRLDTVGYQWHAGCRGLQGLDRLTRARLWGIGKAKNGLPLLVPKSLRHLELVRFGHAELNLGPGIPALDQLHISRARELTALPAMERVRSLEMAFVGKDGFDYESIPEAAERVDLSACAPIPSWAFLGRLRSLKSLLIDRTPCPVPTPAEREMLERIANLHVPHVDARFADLSIIRRETEAADV